MKLYADSAGKLLALRRSDQLSSENPPVGTAETLDFDGSRNAHLVAGLDLDWEGHRLVGGVLTRDGKPLLIVPSSTIHANRAELAAIRQQLATFVSTPNGQLTAADVINALKAQIRLDQIALEQYISEKGG